MIRKEESNMDLLKIMKNRRSVRSYTDENVTEKNIEMILMAGMLAPSGKAIRPWEFIVIRERSVLDKMADFLGVGSCWIQGRRKC